MGERDDVDPVYITPRLVSQLSHEVVLEAFERVSQSQRGFQNYNELRIQIDRVFIPKGSGRKRPLDISNTKLKRNCFYDTVQFMGSQDFNCFTVSLALAIIIKTEKDFPSRERYFRKHINAVKLEVINLTNKVGIDFNMLKRPASIQDFQIFQEALSNYTSLNGKIRSYKILIYDKHAQPIFSGNLPDGVVNFEKIFLSLRDNHFTIIRSMTALLGVGFFCTDCHKGNKERSRHKNCIYTCDRCFAAPRCKSSRNFVFDEKHCPDCCRFFHNDECFNKHKPTVCKQVRFCSNCKRRKYGSAHKCNEFNCKTCCQTCEFDHDCMMASYKPKKLPEKHAYVFYDLETMAENQTFAEGDAHVVNLCVSNVVCHDCLEIADDEEFTCQTCGPRLKIFRFKNDDNVAAEFLDYIIELSDKMSVTVIAHNGSRYDHIFIIKRIFQRPELLRDRQHFFVGQTTKIYLFKLANITFVDSFNFAQCGLAKLPKAYGLGNDLFKGHFPHKFNIRSNQNYVGAYPDKSFYGVEGMKRDELAAFNRWYETKIGEEFDFQEQLVAYCVLDVKILRLFCLKLSKEVYDETTTPESPGMQIFRESCTLASYCNRRFRMQFYDNNIAVIPQNGYRLRQNQSVVALKWLAYMEKYVYLTQIKSAYRGNEHIITINGNKFYIDGYLEVNKPNGEREKICLEFLGCYYHGHNCTNPGLVRVDDKDILAGTIQSLIFEETEQRLQVLRNYGYTVVKIWECDFRKMLKQNPELSEELKSIDKNKLLPEDAFFGGSTDVVRPYFKCPDNLEIRYYDVCSLYPTVNKYDKNIINTPKVYIGKECLDFLRGRDGKPDFSKAEGLIKCFVIPPTNIIHPVLPVKLNGKLLLPLCYKCAEAENQNRCNHNARERGWIGTYVVDELRLALEENYIVKEIYEIWQYETINGLFAKYVKHFQTKKQYASALPEGYTMDNIDEFIHEYKVKEGVELDKKLFKPDPSKRQCAKTDLNNLWGKFAQRKRSATVLVTEPAEFFKILQNPNFEVSGFRVMSDETILITYDDLNSPPLKTGNVVVAAFTTAMARIRLHRILKAVGEKCLYFDTDSVIFIHEKGTEPVLKTGNFLGDLTNELLDYGENSYIDEFVSTGPKSYSFRVVNTKSGEDAYVTKVKGITLNVTNAEKINFESMRNQMINAPHADPIEVDATRFVRDPDMRIRTVKRKKLFKPVISKRRLLDLKTLPYGYRK